MSDSKQAPPPGPATGFERVLPLAPGGPVESIVASDGAGGQWRVRGELYDTDDAKGGAPAWYLVFEKMATAGERTEVVFAWEEPHANTLAEWRALARGCGLIGSDVGNSSRGIKVTDGVIEFRTTRMGAGCDADLAVRAPFAELAAPLATVLDTAAAEGWAFAPPAPHN